MDNVTDKIIGVHQWDLTSSLHGALGGNLYRDLSRTKRTIETLVDEGLYCGVRPLIKLGKAELNG